MKYRNYNSEDLSQILDNPREIAKDPYKLLTSYILNNIREVVCYDDEDDNSFWGKRISETICKGIIKSSIEDFVEAGLHGITVSINGNSYSIRKPNTLNPKSIWDIICFPKSDDALLIDPSGVFNVVSVEYESYDKKHQAYEERRDYHRKVLMLGKDDIGWNQLTDMEVAIYCWCQYMKKIRPAKHVSVDDVQQWYDKWHEYFELPLKNVMACFTDDVLESENYNSRSIFDDNKVRTWNKENQQSSVVDEITDDQIDSWWYNYGWQKYPVI